MAIPAAAVAAVAAVVVAAAGSVPHFPGFRFADPMPGRALMPGRDSIAESFRRRSI